MQTLTIETSSRESALNLSAFMSRFAPAIEEAAGGRYNVKVDLRGNRCDVVAVLNAVERYVSYRGRRAEVVLDGRKYTLIAAD